MVALLQSSLLGVTALVGVPFACLVAVAVFLDARGAGLDGAGAWALRVGAASVACFVLAGVGTLPLWRALVGDGRMVVTAPWQPLAVVLGVGVALTLVVLGGYGLGPRRTTAD